MSCEHHRPVFWQCITRPLLVLESHEYDLPLLPSLIYTASACLMLVFQTDQPTYMFFHNILKKNRQKNSLLVFSFCFFFLKFKVCPALFISVAFQMCMSNELQSQHRPSVKSVTRADLREELQTRCASHPLSKPLLPQERHWLLLHTIALPSLLLQKSNATLTFVK